MRTKWMLAPCLAASLAAPAWADMIFANSGTFIVPGAVGGDTNTSPQSIAADDGAGPGVSFNNPHTAGNPETFYFQASFGTVAASNQGAAIVLYLNNLSTAPNIVFKITAVRWQQGAGLAPTVYADLTSGFSTVTLTTADANRNFQIAGSLTTTNYTFTGTGSFDAGQFDTVMFTMQIQDISGVPPANVSGGGSTISIDAVSNPEPGTMALFGLGALGLGGLAWRRRTKRLAIARA